MKGADCLPKEALLCVLSAEDFLVSARMINSLTNVCNSRWTSTEVSFSGISFVSAAAWSLVLPEDGEDDDEDDPLFTEIDDDAHHDGGASSIHESLQPSPLSVFASSHCSTPECWYQSPHVASKQLVRHASVLLPLPSSHSSP